MALNKEQEAQARRFEDKIGEVVDDGLRHCVPLDTIRTVLQANAEYLHERLEELKTDEALTYEAKGGRLADTFGTGIK